MANVPNQHQAVRPTLLRGNTVPLYVRPTSSASSADTENQQPPLSARPGGAYATIGESVKPCLLNPCSRLTSTCSCSRYYPLPSGSRTNDPFARRDAPPSANGRYPQQAQWQVPPTPPLSTSPSSAESYPDFYPSPGSGSAQALHGQTYCGHAPPNGMRTGRSHSGAEPLTAMMSPTATTSPASFDVLRSTRKQRPGAPPMASAPMSVETTATEHILSAKIGPGFNSNCITIAARKGNNLDIVADRWDLEDCK